ncbi:hypothetical protein ACFQGT_00455 [Natrialbaceae archaeon GCM10025810]
MGKFIPDPQIGTLGGTLMWFFGISLIVVFLFTTGVLPVLIWAVVWGAILIVLYFALARLLFRLKRGK